MSGEPAGVRQIVRVESGYAYGVVGADLHVWPDQGPVYVLLEHGPQAEAASEGRLEQPSHLLDTRYRVVDFTGRQTERDELAAWRDAGAPRLSVRWLHAPGGQGKTRLAAEFAADSAAAGWKVARAEQGPQRKIRLSPGSQDLRLWYECGLLLVVDYADRWPVSHLNWLFSNALFHQQYRVRILMLARSLHPWPVIRASLAAVRAEARAQALAPLSEDLGERERMFAAARGRFADRYGLPDSDSIRPPSPLDRPEFGLVLAVHMAALAAVDARARGARPPADPAGLSAYLLGREYVHWDSPFNAGVQGKDYATAPTTMAHTVFTAALTGATTYDHGVWLLRGLDLESKPARVLADHAQCYPPADPGTVLEPLYPDRLAEDYLALTFPGHTASDCPPQPWAEPTTQALAARDPQGDPPAHTVRLLTFLTAGAERWPHVTRYLNTLLRSDPALAVAAGGAALIALAALPDLDPEVLEAIEACLPPHGQIDLDPGIAAVTARLAEHRLTASSDPLSRIHIYMTLATRQGRAGLHEQAVESNGKALAIARRLDGADPDNAAIREHLLGVVSADRGVALAAAHRWDLALAPEQEAVEIYRRLVAVDKLRYEPSLAAALTHLGVSLSHLERREEALRAEEEAVAIRSRLAEADPAGYESDLALSLHNLGNRLADVGRWKEALEPTEKAVAIRKRLVQTDPGEEVHLARSLSTLGQRYRYLRRRREALEAEQEAVTIFERLAAANPAAYESALALSLANLSGHLVECGEPNEALSRSEQALAIRQRLGAREPDAYEPEHAESLAVYGMILAKVGRHQEALAAVTKAVGVIRQRAEANPEVHEPRLALVLTDFAKVSLDGRHDLDAAIAASAEALDIYHGIAGRNPSDAAVFAPYFQATLALHAGILEALGRAAEAGALRRMLRTGDITEVRRMMSPRHHP